MSPYRQRVKMNALAHFFRKYKPKIFKETLEKSVLKLYCLLNLSTSISYSNPPLLCLPTSFLYTSAFLCYNEDIYYLAKWAKKYKNPLFHNHLIFVPLCYRKELGYEKKSQQGFEIIGRNVRQC